MPDRRPDSAASASEQARPKPTSSGLVPNEIGPDETMPNEIGPNRVMPIGSMPMVPKLTSPTSAEPTSGESTSDEATSVEPTSVELGAEADAQTDTDRDTAPRSPKRRSRTRWLWWLATWCALALAALGVLLPGLPTVPFVLVAAFCASGGSPRMRRWLESHDTFGPMIRDWEREGAVSRRAKRLALGMMLLCSAVLALVASFFGWLVASLCMAAVAIWLWRRPEPVPAPAPAPEPAPEPAPGQ